MRCVTEASIHWCGGFPDGIARVNDVDIVHGEKLVEQLAQCHPRGLKDPTTGVDALEPGAGESSVGVASCTSR